MSCLAISCKLSYRDCIPALFSADSSLWTNSKYHFIMKLPLAEVCISSCTPLRNSIKVSSRGQNSVS